MYFIISWLERERFTSQLTKFMILANILLGWMISMHKHRKVKFDPFLNCVMLKLWLGLSAVEFGNPHSSGC
jgi:hypothetical protein